MGSKTAAVAATAIIATIQVLLDFKSFVEKKFGPFLSKVLLCAKNNPYLKPPTEILDDCTARADDYFKARTNRDANPSPANTQFLEAAQVKAADSFEVLAKWVQDNCGNDLAVLLSFGFKAAKTTRSSATQLSAPTNVEYSYGMPGTIVFKCKAFGRGVQYFVECSTDGGLTFTMCGVSTKSFSIIANGLVRGKEYVFRIYGVNDAGNGRPWTSAAIIAAV
jgi:hypothetical protein